METSGGAAAALRMVLDTACWRYADDENDFRDDLTVCAIKLPLFT